MRNGKSRVLSSRLLPAACRLLLPTRLPPDPVSAYLLPKRLALVILQAFPLLPEVTSL
jgi:hypothetical protein